MDDNGDAEGNYTVVSLLPVQDDYGYYADSSVSNESATFFNTYTKNESNYYSHESKEQTYDYLVAHSNTTVRLSMQPVGFFTQVSAPTQSPPSSPSSSSATLSSPSVSSAGTTTTQHKNENPNNNIPDKMNTPADDVFVSHSP